MEIEAVIFDLGGTLIEYSGTYARWPDLETPGFTAAYERLRREGLTLPPFEAFRDAGFELLPGRWQGATAGGANLRLAELLAEVALALGLETTDDIVLAEAAELYERAICDQAELLEDTKDTLAEMRARGYKIGLLSNTMFRGAAHIADLERFGLRHYFDAMLFSADAGKWKPSPEPYLQLLEELDVAPEAAVFVGDDPANDVVGAQRAGMRAIYVHANGRFQKPERVEPDAEVARLGEVPQVLRRWENGVGP